MPERFRRKTAASGQVDYSDPIRIHNTKQKRVDLVPFYVKRSEGDELAAKLVEKRAGSRRDVEISLNKAALEALGKALSQCGAIAEQDPGSYLVVETDGTLSREAADALSADQLAHTIRGLISSDAGVLEQLFRHEESSRELTAAIRSYGRLSELEAAVRQLRGFLSSGEDREKAYQAWCETHSWAFGNAHVVNDEVRSISASDNIDLLLPQSIGGFRDLIELKIPSMAVINWDSSHKNYYWSAQTSKAIGQCHRYLDVLHQDVGMTGLRDHPQVVSYHPRATIVIGRSSFWSDAQHQALQGLNTRLAHISVITFDHLLDQAENTLALLRDPEPPTEVIVLQDPDPTDDDAQQVPWVPDDRDGWSLEENHSWAPTDEEAWSQQNVE